MTEERTARRQRLTAGLQEAAARRAFGRIEALLVSSRYRTLVSANAERALIETKRASFTGDVSRRRWTVDLEEEALAVVERCLKALGHGVLVSLSEEFAADIDGERLSARSLVEALGDLAVVSTRAPGGLIFEAWTDPSEGEWYELVTW